MRKLQIGYLALSLWAIPVLAQTPAVPKQAPPKPPQDVCERAFSFEFGLQIASTPFPDNGAVVGFPVQIRASQPTLVITVPSGPKCDKIGILRKPQNDYVWRVTGPVGSHSQLDNTTGTLLVSFTPDKSGTYTVFLDACGNGCSIDGVPVDLNDIPDKERHIVIKVDQQAQALPNIIPPAQPNPVGEKTHTDPEEYTEAIKFCGSKELLGIGLSPEWFTTDTTPAAARRLELAEGRVYETGVSRIDTPRGHLDNDVDVVFDVDPWLHKLLIKDTDNSTPIDIGKGPFNFPLKEGALKTEWEWPEWDEGFRPLIGDRISVLGYHVIDCGHDINTEIHPPVAVAVHRPLPVRLPPSTSLEQGKPSVPIGSNVFVPGIITDIWVHLRGGDALECLGDSLRQSRLVPVVVGGQTIETALCVPQPNLPSRLFEFHVYLPVSPHVVVKNLTKGNPPVPALFTQIVNHPETPSDARTDLALQIDQSHATGIEDQPYVTVSIDISKMKTGESFAKRLISAWVYPDIKGNNFGLRASGLRLTELEVTDDGDSLPGNSGDWRLWVGYPNAERPWTRLIDCTGCVDEKTYPPSDSTVFRPGTLGSGGALKGEFLTFTVFPAVVTEGRLRMTGYEQDTIGSDDVGEVTKNLPAPGGPLEAPSFCIPEVEGIEGELTNSRCAAYIARFILEPSQTPTKAVLSPEAKAFLNRLMIGEPLFNTMPPITDSELFAGPVTAAILPLTSHREVEEERWQETFKPARLVNGLAPSKNPDAFMKDIRRHVAHVLGASPSPQQRAKVAADLRKLKPSIPARLYQKYLCDLETGRSCGNVPK